MKSRLLLLLCLACLLGACSSTKRPPPKVYTTIIPPKGPSEEPMAQIQLAEAAASVSRSLAKMAAVEAAATPPITSKHLTRGDAYNMTGQASVDWSGPIGDLVAKIAQSAHYRLRVLGNPPAIPIIVSINAENTPLGDILRDADFQAGRQANIIIYSRSRVIELRYAHS